MCYRRAKADVLLCTQMFLQGDFFSKFAVMPGCPAKSLRFEACQPPEQQVVVCSGNRTVLVPGIETPHIPRKETQSGKPSSICASPSETMKGQARLPCPGTKPESQKAKRGTSRITPTRNHCAKQASNGVGHIHVDRNALADGSLNI